MEVDLKLADRFDYVSSIRVVTTTLFVIFLSNIVARKLGKAIEFKRKIDKLPGPPTANLILGNIPSKVFSLFAANQQRLAADFYTSQIQSLLGHTLIYKDSDLYRVWIGQEPVVCVWKPEMVERVLGDNFLLEKSYHYDFLKPWLGNGLLTSPGRIWRPRRKLLVPSFHFNILQAFVPVFDRKSKLLVEKLHRKLKLENSKEKSVVIDITPVITACALDAICETIMGVSVDAQNKPNNDYCESVYIVGETFLERIIQPRYWLDTVFRYTELGKLYTYHLCKLHTFTRTVIAERKKERAGKLITDNNKSINEFESNKQPSNCLVNRLKVLEQTATDAANMSSPQGAPKLPKAFLDLLLDNLNSRGDQALSDEEIREEVDTFMFEGHDTTAMALSWTLFLLGHNAQVQKKLAEEVDDFFESTDLSNLFQNGGLKLDQIKKLKYLDCVVKETLRLCPSVPFIGRKTIADMKIGEYDIPANTVLFVLIYQLHRNPDVFTNPEKFDPDRFLPQNMNCRHPFAYVPFSAGPRNCIGQKFAMAEMKIVLLNLIRNFEFESITPLDKARVQMEMVLRPKCSLDIRVKQRLHI